jgi:hypothetical protein
MIEDNLIGADVAILSGWEGGQAAGLSEPWGAAYLAVPLGAQKAT